mmetsp:Transcript_22734/g.76348  ORF Transcript_22734/g.76348 Transcript_22734/m.76348 type:complete len:285 (+) Transcript_22734:285-1139(+)
MGTYVALYLSCGSLYLLRRCRRPELDLGVIRDIREHALTPGRGPMTRSSAVRDGEGSETGGLTVAQRSEGPRPRARGPGFANTRDGVRRVLPSGHGLQEGRGQRAERRQQDGAREPAVRRGPGLRPAQGAGDVLHPQRRGPGMGLPERADVLQRHAPQGLDPARGGHGGRRCDPQRGERARMGAGARLGAAPRARVPKPAPRALPRKTHGALPAGPRAPAPGLQAPVRPPRLGGRPVRPGGDVPHRFLQRQRAGARGAAGHVHRRAAQHHVCVDARGPHDDALL